MFFSSFFFFFFDFLVWEGGRRDIFFFSHFFDIGYFFCFLLFYFIFLGEGESFFLIFSMFLVFLTTFGTDSFCPRPLFFFF